MDELYHDDSTYDIHLPEETTKSAYSVFIKAETEDPMQQNQTVTENTQHLQKCVKFLEQTNQETKAKCRSLEHANGTLEQTRRKLLLDNRTLENTKQNQAQTVERLENEIKSKDDVISALQRERDALKDEITNMKIQLAQVTRDWEHTSEMMNRYETDLRQFKAESEKYRSKSLELEKQQAEANIQLKYLKEDYTGLSKKEDSTGDLISGEHTLSFISVKCNY